MKKNKATRFAISIEEDLFDDFNETLKRKGYPSRSQAVQNLIRRFVTEEEWEEKGDAMGTLTLSLKLDQGHLLSNLQKIKNDYHEEIMSSSSAMVTVQHSIEVLIVQGKGEQLKKLADQALHTEGVTFCKLSLTPLTLK